MLKLNDCGWPYPINVDKAVADEARFLLISAVSRKNRGITSLSHSPTGVPHRFFETVHSKSLRLHASKATR